VPRKDAMKPISVCRLIRLTRHHPGVVLEHYPFCARRLFVHPRKATEFLVVFRFPYSFREKFEKSDYYSKRVSFY
jgi:hypothetical protein